MIKSPSLFSQWGIANVHTTKLIAHLTIGAIAVTGSQANADTPMEKTLAAMEKCAERKCTSLQIDKGMTEIPTEVVAYPGLTQLRLHGSKVEDLSPISAMVELENIDLANTSIEDLSALKDMPSLDYIGLSRTRVSDVSPLGSLHTLEDLDLRDSSVSDLSPLADLTGLRRLIISDTPITDISAIANFGEPISRTSRRWRQSRPCANSISAIRGLKTLAP